MSLAHDLGHTPFGHAGEDALNECMNKHGGFDHNLQTIRIVMFLENKYLKFKGLNLTIPLKEEALKHINKKDKIVNITGAANVLIFSKNGYIEGKNTDVYGFKKSILNLVKNKKRKMAMIIGSGGAARAVLYVLIQMKYKKIILYNRTKKNAEIIKKNFLKNLIQTALIIKYDVYSIKKNRVCSLINGYVNVILINNKYLNNFMFLKVLYFFLRVI